MKAMVDENGRIALPAEVYTDAGIRPGMELEVQYDGTHIGLSACGTPVRFEQRGALVVAVPLAPVEPLRQEQVEATIRHVRSERNRNALG